MKACALTKAKVSAKSQLLIKWFHVGRERCALASYKTALGGKP
jgi:hypothetical protein